MKYGLIGEHLSHSFSKEIHSMLADYNYELCELSPSALDEFMKKREFSAINVTIPYKEKVIPYLYSVDPLAQMIGAVNTVVNKDGLLYGYNTDFYGMSEIVRRNRFVFEGAKVLILGSGGTSNTAFAVSRHLGASSVIKVSRSPKGDSVSYNDAVLYHSDADFIINTTPVGMFPEINALPISLDSFKNLKGVIDAIYNPIRTRLVSEAKKRGINAEGGFYMLVAQAVKACELFLSKDFSHETIEKAYKKIVEEKENIVLIGMPGSGKTTLGKMLAECLTRSFLDTDEEIKNTYKREISESISSDGEEVFRDYESLVVRRASAVTSTVISTGGGAILRKENLEALKMNGKIVFIDRHPDLIMPTSDRPLSSDRASLYKRYNERIELYRAAADVIIDGNGSLAEVFERIIKGVYGK